jgi:GTPase SAR1 family protein
MHHDSFCSGRNTQGFLITYSPMSRQSFEDVKMWYNRIVDTKKQKFALVLVATQADKTGRREVTEADGAAQAAEWGCAFFETSAATGQGVDEPFQGLVRYLRESAARGLRAEGAQLSGSASEADVRSSLCKCVVV